MNLHSPDSLIVPVVLVKMGRSSSMMRVLIGGCRLHREPFNTRQSLLAYKHIPAWNTSLPPATPTDKFVFVTPGWRSARYLVGPTKGLCKMWAFRGLFPRFHRLKPHSKYNTKLSKRSLSYLSNPESSSITFDRDGQHLLHP